MTTADADALAAHGLRERWRSAPRFVVLDMAGGSLARFGACLQAWRDRPQGRLHVVTLMPMLPAADAVRRQLGNLPCAAELLAAWPAATPDLHRLAFDDGAVQWLLFAGPLRERLAQTVARVDAFRLDDAALDADADPGWAPRLFKALARLAAPAATLTLPEPGPLARAALRSAGFNIDGHATADGLRSARYAPPFTPRRAARPSTAAAPGRVLVVGAGLAGCATAWALAQQGWHSCVVDRHDAPAREASGNPAGLFHGIVNAQDGAHARFNRAAALEARRAVQVAIERHGVAGSAGGLLRLETALPDAAAMQAVLHRLGLPADCVQALPAEAASALAGIALAHPCWHYPGGGWVDPAGLARSFLERGAARVRFRGGVAVAALRRSADGCGWQLLDAAGAVLDEAALVVLCPGGDPAALLGRAAPSATALQRVRGQLSIARSLPGLQLPRLPVAGAGYLLPAVGGMAVFGATAQAGDDDAAVRAADHAHNLDALRRLTGLPLADADPGALHGRTAWRCVAGDRLPLIGAIVDDAAVAEAPADSLSRLSRLPRLPGLFTFAALGSRGITWAALGAQLLAATVTGAPLPLPAALRDAVDPARFAVRRSRRAGIATTGDDAAARAS